MLDVSRIESSLRSDMWRVCAYETLESTNLIVKERLRQGESEGCVVVSLKQDGGYGRQGRTWMSPAGGLYFSFGLHPNTAPSKLSTLTLVVALAVHDALAQLGHTTRIKWPNDILLGEGKVCGISCEVVAGAVCVGVGLNVYEPKDKEPIQGKYNPAYLCSDEYAGLKHQIEFLETCAAAILNAFESRYKAWQQEGFACMMSSYHDLLSMKGSLVRIATIADDTTAEGVVVGVDELGRLLLEVDSGTEVVSNQADGIGTISESASSVGEAPLSTGSAGEALSSASSAEMAAVVVSSTEATTVSTKKSIAVSSGEVHLL